ncbi:MAG: hypothetical protein ACREUA_05655 [Burkholderiales bacterium]
MRFSEDDWRALRNPLMVLGLVVALCATSLSYTASLKQRARLENESLQQTLRDFERRYHKSDEEKLLIERYIDPFRQLQNEGIYGNEQRLNWVDALRSIHQRLKLGGLRYELSAQNSHTPPPGVNPGSLELRQSEMKLTLDLLHEGDLMRFFEAVNDKRVGLYHLTSCTLTRREDAGGMIQVQGNVQAQCELLWLTLG